MSLAGPLSPSSSGDAAGRGDDARSPPPRISSDGLLPTLPGGRVNSQASMGEVLAGLEQSVLPSLAPISPLSSSPYFSQGFATFPSMSDDLSSAASPRSMATNPSPFRAQPPPRLNLPPLHLDSFRQQTSPDDYSSPTQLSYRRTPSPASPQISQGLPSPTKAGRAIVLNASDAGRSTDGEQGVSPSGTARLVQGAATPSSSSSSHVKRQLAPSAGRTSSDRFAASAAQPPLPMSATSDQFPLDPPSSAASSPTTLTSEQRPLGRKGTVGLSLVKASNEARGAHSPGGRNELMRGLGFVEPAEEKPEATPALDETPETATSGTFGSPPQVTRRISDSSHLSSPPPAPSPMGPPPPVPVLPRKSSSRAGGSSSPVARVRSVSQQSISSRDARPSTAMSGKSSASSQSSIPASTRKGGLSSTGNGGLALPPLPLPPPVQGMPRSDSGVLDPRMLDGIAPETASPEEVLNDERPSTQTSGDGEKGEVNFAGIGSRHLFSPSQGDIADAAVPSPAVNRSSTYDSGVSLGPTPSQRRALPHPPQQGVLPNHPPPPQPPPSFAIQQSQSSQQQQQKPQQRGSYIPQAQIASPPTLSKRLIEPNSRYQAGPQGGAASDDPYQAARRSLDPQAFQGMVGQVGQMTLGPEVCLECMMRDRDLIHVDVSSPGVWARHSDADLHDLALREADGEDVTPFMAGGITWEGGGPIGMDKVPGLRVKARRTMAGDRLTEAALKEWTLKSPPAATHRFQTLQKYLLGQLRLIAELAGPGSPTLLAGVSSEVETRVLRSKIQNTFAPLRRDEPVTMTPAEAARLRPAKARQGANPDSMVEVENYDGKLSFDRERSRRRSTGVEILGKHSRNGVPDGIGPTPPMRDVYGQLPSQPSHQGLRSTTMPMALPSSASASNFPLPRGPVADGSYRPSSPASFATLNMPRGAGSGPIPDGQPVRPFSFAMWAGRTRSSSNASQDGTRGGIFKGRFGGSSGRSEASDMTTGVGGPGGSAWGGSGSMMNMHVALDRDQERQARQGFTPPQQQHASTDALNQRWRNDGDNLSYAASSQFYPYHYPGSEPTSPGGTGRPGAPPAGQPESKKKKGFKAFFSKLGGGSVKSSSSFGNSPQLANGQFSGAPSSLGQPSPLPAGSEEFGPLAPPPSLNFLSRGKTPSSSSLRSLSSGPNSPRGPGQAGQDRSRAGSVSSSSIFSSPAIVVPALSSGQSFSSSAHPRSVSTPINVGPGFHHGKSPSVSPSAAPSATSMSPASGTFPVRRGSRDTLGSRQSVFASVPDVLDGLPSAAPPRIRASPGTSLTEEGTLAASQGEYMLPAGDARQQQQRRSNAPAGPSPPGGYVSTLPTTAHRLSVASGPPSAQLAAAPSPHPGLIAHRRRSSNFQKDLPPLPPASPSPQAPLPLGHPLHPSFSAGGISGLGANGWPDQVDVSSLGQQSQATLRSNGTDKSAGKKEKKRGKLSGFFGVGSSSNPGAAKKQSFEAPRNAPRDEGSLIGASVAPRDLFAADR